MTIAEQLTTVNTNLGLINSEVATQEDLIAQIKTKLSGGLIDGGSAGGKVHFGTVTTNSTGEATIPYPSFSPNQMMIWNIIKRDQWEESGDDSLVRYLLDGIMLCAVRTSDGWVSQYTKYGSGVAYIAQASADQAPYEPEQDLYSRTNMIDDGSSLTWALGAHPEINGANDISNITFNYVLVG